MKLTHIRQTHIEKPLIACPVCGLWLFHSRWVVEIKDKRVCLCEECVAKVRKEADRYFMEKVRGLVNASKITGTGTP